MKRKILLASMLGVICILATACPGTKRVYTHHFTRTRTIAISRFVDDNANLGAAAPPVVAAYVCKWTIEVPPAAAVCAFAVGAGYLRLKDVLGQIKRSKTEKCLKIEYVITPIPIPSGFANFYKSVCPKPNPYSADGSNWYLDGKKVGAGGGGGGSW